jgi:hypothetical protein
MQQVTLTKDRNDLIDLYRSQFTLRFGTAPILDLDTALQVCDWAINKLGVKRAKELIRAYLQMQDDWIEKQGFPLELFRKQINQVIISSSHQNKIGKDLYFVGKTESGTPIVSENPKALTAGVEVKPWEEYLREQEPEDEYYK